MVNLFYTGKGRLFECVNNFVWVVANLSTNIANVRDGSAIRDYMDDKRRSWVAMLIKYLRQLFG